MRFSSPQEPTRPQFAGPAVFTSRVPAEAEHVAQIRRKVDALAERAGFDRARRGDVALVVAEACANVVVHAYAAAPERGVLAVDARIVDDVLEVVVADEGAGMTPRPDSPGLGLGLPLMVSLTDTLELRENPAGGTEILMVFENDQPAMAADWSRTG